MRFEDERYVRLYTRDTVGWRMLPWQSRALLPLLLRKVDRAGLLDLDEHGAAGLAATVELPIEVVEPGLAGLVAAGTVEVRGSVLLMPKFLEAQEATSTDAQRKRDQRERARAGAKLEEVASRLVTERHETGQLVTMRDEVSRDVTRGHSEPNRAEPNRTEPNRTEPFKLVEPEPKPAPTDRRAESLLEELNLARLAAIKGAHRLKPIEVNLKQIRARLAEGATEEEIRHVIAVCAAEVRAKPESEQWFNAETPFRPENFQRKLAMTVRGASRPAGAKPGEPERPRGPSLAELKAQQDKARRELHGKDDVPCAPPTRWAP